MKHLMKAIVPILALGALLALIGPGVASATVLCNSTTTPCEAKYGENTTFGGEQIGASKVENGLTVVNTCSNSTLSATLTKKIGGATETPILEVKTLTWEECTVATKTVNGGTLEVHAINGTDNGQVTAIGTELTVLIGGNDCIYGTGVGIELGTIVGGLSPILVVNATFKRTAGGTKCPAELRWTSEYPFRPILGPLYVEPS